jgi:uncharacterized protein (DUF3820 family)
MTDTEPKIIPFGKYKGRLVEEGLADDPAYLQWLAGQDWFRAKFNILHQVIINRGAEPEETPDHNAMQVKFLDDDFCLRFFQCIDPECMQKARAQLEKARVHDLNLIGRATVNEQEGLERENRNIADYSKQPKDERDVAYYERRRSEETRRAHHQHRLSVGLAQKIHIAGRDRHLQSFSQVRRTWR